MNVIRGGSKPEADWRLTSSSFANRADALLEDHRESQERRQTSARELPSFVPTANEREVALPGGQSTVVPSREQVAQMFGLGGKGQPLTQMEVHRDMRKERLGVPSLLHGINQKTIPTVVVGKER